MHKWKPQLRKGRREVMGNQNPFGRFGLALVIGFIVFSIVGLLLYTCNN